MFATAKRGSLKTAALLFYPSLIKTKKPPQRQRPVWKIEFL
jgi:hypothetical protein